MLRALRLLAIATTVGMFLVLVMGAAVTNTGSAEGCGRSWPLCNGQFVPEFTVATAIEYSHRAVTGVEGVLVLALSAAMLLLWRSHREVQLFVPLMLGTLLLQAGLGAAAVMWPQSAAVLASHFGVSLVAFASTFLSTAFVLSITGQGLQPETSAPRGLRNAAIGVTCYVLLVVYLGAYVRHAGVSLACADWPLCNGQVVPSLEGASGVVFAHRVAALGVLVALHVLASRARRAGLAVVAARTGLILAVLQAASGAAVVWSRLDLFSTLAHAGIMALLFACLSLVLRRVLLVRPAVLARGGRLPVEGVRVPEPVR